MGDSRAFITLERRAPKKRPTTERINDWNEVYLAHDEPTLRAQASRCMDCGVPFCHNGCPLGNLIPDWNDLVYRGHWRDSLDRLHATNNFPEFTGMLCPAPCEDACVLAINDDPVTIKAVELSIIDHAFEKGWVTAQPPKARTGRSVAIIGSGPAGLAAAQQLNRAGHMVTVFERDDRIGGLLRYGIPDFKMAKSMLDRRLALLEEEGIVFCTHVEIGVTIAVDELRRRFDAIVLAVGADRPRDLTVPGRELDGVMFAMEYLTQQNRRGAGDEPIWHRDTTAEGKHVMIIGGGDTGADCYGTAIRQGARSVTQFQIHNEPPVGRPELNPWWPEPAMILRTSPAHEEGGIREWGVHTTHLSGEDGAVKKLHAVKVQAIEKSESGGRRIVPVPGSEIAYDADLVLIAVGYDGVRRNTLLTELGIATDTRGAIIADHQYQTTVPGVFVAGDARRGASLIVWAIAEGREAAHWTDTYLMGRSDLPLTRYS